MPAGCEVLDVCASGLQLLAHWCVSSGGRVCDSCRCGCCCCFAGGLALAAGNQLWSSQPPPGAWRLAAAQPGRLDVLRLALCTQSPCCMFAQHSVASVCYLVLKAWPRCLPARLQRCWMLAAQSGYELPQPPVPRYFTHADKGATCCVCVCACVCALRSADSAHCDCTTYCATWLLFEVVRCHCHEPSPALLPVSLQCATPACLDTTTACWTRWGTRTRAAGSPCSSLRRHDAAACSPSSLCALPCPALPAGRLSWQLARRMLASCSSVVDSKLGSSTMLACASRSRCRRR